MLAKVPEPVLEFSAGVVGGGKDFFARVVAQGHEGVMAKDLASRYSPGKRSSAWRKIKPVAVIPCVVVGSSQYPSLGFEVRVPKSRLKEAVAAVEAARQSGATVEGESA